MSALLSIGLTYLGYEIYNSTFLEDAYTKVTNVIDCVETAVSNTFKCVKDIPADIKKKRAKNRIEEIKKKYRKVDLD